MAENVKVAVRVRPFREKDRNAALIVKMEGKSTMLQNPDKPNEKPRKFTFDYSYWSHDGYKEKTDGYLEKDKASSKYCDQANVFDDLGKDMLKNAWEGYNSTLFAYGQTGSGKSYSIVGYGVNKGVVPVLADQLFAQIDEKNASQADAQFEVTFSMLEIYSEQVRDLLNPATIKSKGGLKVRENPERGFYVQGLNSVAVANYADIEERMAEGTKNRTVAATNMNATSSRAHTIVGITFVQKSKNSAGEEMTKTSIINLVDLAGSERVKSTGATGDRLKEGAGINLSLSSLGNVISALADRSGGKKVRVPYRDSALTKLLKNALAGNSKTVMIAAVSPADINYDETLSTLRYADRAKQIKTVAKVNEDPTAKLIRELEEENARLKDLLSKGGAAAVAATVQGDSEELTEAEKEAIKQEYEELMAAAVDENERRMKDMEKSWQEKLELAQKEHVSSAKELQAKMEKTPHLYNLNADPQMCKVIVHILEGGQEFTVGKPSDEVKIPLAGSSIMDQHAVIRNDSGNIFIKTMDPDAKVRFNGELLLPGDEMQLRQNDRILFGTSHLYVFGDPVQYKKSPQDYPEISYEMAQDEISACIGLSSAAEKSHAEAQIREELAELRPAVDEANSISEELDQKVIFELLVVPPHHRGSDKGKTEIYVKMKHLENGMEWVWSRETFINRKYLMQEMYEDNKDGQTISSENNPFIEDADKDVLIGSAVVSPQCLAYMIDLSQQFSLVGFGGEDVGVLNASLVPCDSKGKEIIGEESEEFIDDPKELIGKKYKVKVKVESARGIPKRYKDVFVKYDMFLELDNKTKVVSGTGNPDFKYSNAHQFNPVTTELVSWLRNGNLIFQVWGKQLPAGTSRRHMNTRQLSKTQTLTKAAAQAQRSLWQKVSVDNLARGVLERRCDILERKLHQIRVLVRKAEERKIVSIRTDNLKRLLVTQQPGAVDQMIAKLAKQADSGGADDSSSKVCLLM